MALNTVMGIFPFRTSLEPFRNIVCPLVETHTGLKYVDATSYYESQNPKMDFIAQMIRDARLIIVDISEQNPNVFMELGIAYSLNKPIIFLCRENAWTDHWKKRPPFDIQGRELLVYKNDKHLKVQLGRYISDSLYKTSETALSWDSVSSVNHVKSTGAIEIFEPGRIWNALDRAVRNFVLSYHVKIHEVRSGRGRHPDVRLYISSAPEGYPCVAVVFPWEASEREPDKLECIITYFSGTGEGKITPQDEAKFGPLPTDLVYDGRAQNHDRLQQVPVRSVCSPPFEYDVFVSCYWPNLVFESTLFDDNIERLYVSLSNLRSRGYPTHFNQYIGFESVNSRVSISNIRVKEVDVDPMGTGSVGS